MPHYIGHHTSRSHCPLAPGMRIVLKLTFKLQHF